MALKFHSHAVEVLVIFQSVYGNVFNSSQSASWHAILISFTQPQTRFDFGAYSNTNIVITVNLVSNMSFNDISDDETLDETPLAVIQRSRVRQREARNLRDLIQDSEHEDCQSEDDGSTDEFLAASPDILHQNSSTSRQA